MGEHAGHPEAPEQCLSKGDRQPQWPLNEGLCGGHRGGRTGACWLHNQLFHNNNHLTSKAGINMGRGMGLFVFSAHRATDVRTSTAAWRNPWSIRWCIQLLNCWIIQTWAYTFLTLDRHCAPQTRWGRLQPGWIWSRGGLFASISIRVSFFSYSFVVQAERIRKGKAGSSWSRFEL